jgi:xylulokinase
MASPVFLGFDLSTQQLKALAIDNELNILHESSVHFDDDLPEYKTQGGVHKQEDNLTVTAPCLLWVKAWDLLFERMKSNGFDFQSVVCVSGTGQQHGSVYWKKGAKDVLKTLKRGNSFHDQLKV